MEGVGVSAHGASVKGSRILVTGSTGFLGSWLTKALLDQGAAVISLVRDQNPGANFHLLGLEKRAQQVVGGLTDAEVVERAMNEYEVDTVLHLAAQTQVGVANRSPRSTFRANVEGTWNVLEAARTTPSVNRIIVASSDKAYGAHEVLPYTEEAELRAKHPYDASKAMAEMLCRTYAHTYGMPIVTTRCANIYGGGDLNFQRILPDVARSIHAGKNPVILSDGTPVRDYIHVDDVVSAYLAVLDNMDKAKGLAFNFGNGRPVSVLEIVETMLKVSGRTDLHADVRGKGRTTGEIDKQYLSSERAQKILGWTPNVPLEAGLKRTLEWYATYLDRGSAHA